MFHSMSMCRGNEFLPGKRIGYRLSPLANEFLSMKHID